MYLRRDKRNDSKARLWKLTLGSPGEGVPEEGTAELRLRKELTWSQRWEEGKGGGQFQTENEMISGLARRARWTTGSERTHSTAPRNPGVWAEERPKRPCPLNNEMPLTSFKPLDFLKFLPCRTRWCSTRENQVRAARDFLGWPRDGPPQLLRPGHCSAGPLRSARPCRWPTRGWGRQMPTRWQVRGVYDSSPPPRIPTPGWKTLSRFSLPETPSQAFPSPSQPCKTRVFQGRRPLGHLAGKRAPPETPTRFRRTRMWRWDPWGRTTQNSRGPHADPGAGLWKVPVAPWWAFPSSGSLRLPEGPPGSWGAWGKPGGRWSPGNRPDALDWRASECGQEAPPSPALARLSSLVSEPLKRDWEYERVFFNALRTLLRGVWAKHKTPETVAHLHRDNGTEEPLLGEVLSLRWKHFLKGSWLAEAVGALIQVIIKLVSGDRTGAEAEAPALREDNRCRFLLGKGWRSCHFQIKIW